MNELLNDFAEKYGERLGNPTKAKAMIKHVYEQMRKKPYTEIGISRIPCKRCGKPSRYQWQVCALNNVYMGVCEKCDIDLNELTLKFFKIKGREKILAKYREIAKQALANSAG